MTLDRKIFPILFPPWLVDHPVHFPPPERKESCRRLVVDFDAACNLLRGVGAIGAITVNDKATNAARARFKCRSAGNGSAASFPVPTSDSAWTLKPTRARAGVGRVRVYRRHFKWKWGAEPRRIPLAKKKSLAWKVPPVRREMDRKLCGQTWIVSDPIARRSV